MNLNEFLQKENCAKEFNICVGNIKVSNERNLYNALRKWYKSLAKSAQNSFDEGYKSYNNCEDRLNSYSSQKVDKVINPIITVRTLFLKQKMILKAVWQLLLKI